MRIISGTARGRILTAPGGLTTRPTAQRTRQAVFDMLLHAPWYGRTALEQAHVLDVFAGTGAMGLEALSRGAQTASFIEQNHAGLNAIRANCRACLMEERSRIIHADATRPPRARTSHTLVFLDPPYHRNLVARALRALWRTGWLAENALIVAETENTPATEQTTAHPSSAPTEDFHPIHAHLPPDTPLKPPTPLAQRRFGIACITIWHHVTSFSS